MASRSLDLAFIALYDLADVSRGSGTWFHLVAELRRQGHRVETIDALPREVPFGTRIASGLARRIGRRHLSAQDPFLGRRIGRLASIRVGPSPARIVLTNDYAVAGRLATDRPVVLYTDAMTAHDPSARNHPHLERLAPWAAAAGIATLRRGLDAADLLVYPTRWAAAQAALHHPPTAAKTEIVPFGANLDDPGPPLPRSAATRPLELLFVGKSWQGKGGEVALGAARELRRRGIETVLHLVGSGPPGGFAADWLRVHGLLDKSRPEDRERLDALYRRAWALLFPSRAEGFGIAAVEAGAYGVPTLGYRTRGLDEAVEDGVSGRLLPPGSGARAFADAATAWLEHPEEHARLAAGARRRYERELNWPQAAARLTELLQGRFPAAADSPNSRRTVCVTSSRELSRSSSGSPPMGGSSSPRRSSGLR